jgi:hypothetical protein
MVYAVRRPYQLGAVSTICLLCALLLAANAAATITVTNDNDSGSGSLRQAIITAPAGETIDVGPGTITLASELTITKPLTIDGAGPEATILRGGGSSRVLSVTGKTTSVSINGLAISDGLVVEPGGHPVGGGVYDSQATLALTNVIVADNHVDADGGPKEEEASALGGGIAAFGPSTLKDVTLIGNDVSAVGGNGEVGGYAAGGGLEAEDQPQLTDVRFIENLANASGGAGKGGGFANAGAMYTVLNESAPIVYRDVELRGNVANATAGAGGEGGFADSGALYLITNEPTVTFAGLTAADNLAIAGSPTAGMGLALAGAMYLKANEGSITVSNATFSGNAARGLGPSGSATAGALWASSDLEPGPVAIVSSTLDGNIAEGASTAAGGNLYSQEGVTARETIVSGGVGQAGDENCYATSPIESLGHNLDSRDECGFHAAGDKVNTNPLLDSLQSNGGPLQTEAIAADSPARDAGASSNCETTDERGAARPQGTACDIGAYELAPPSVTTEAVSATGQTSATLGASAVNPGPGGSASFQYGTTTAYGSQVSAGELLSGLQDVTGLIEVTPGAPGAHAFSAVASGLAPGTTYHFRAVASTGDGTAYGADQTFTTIGVAGCLCLRVSPSPVLSALKLNPSHLRAERGHGASISAAHTPGGATLSYSDSEAATTTFTIQRPRRGYRIGRSCAAKPPRHHRGSVTRCTLYVSLGTFTHVDGGGAVRLHFTGRVNGRPLAPGRYRLTVRARVSASPTSATLTLPFTVIS